LESSSPIHPNSRFPLVILRWLTPATLGTTPHIRMALAFHAENQPRQVAEIILVANPFEREFERFGSAIASDLELGNLESQFSLTGKEQGIDLRQRQSLEKQLADFDASEKAALRHLLVKGQMRSQDFAQFCNENNLRYLDTNLLKAKGPSFIRHNAETGFLSIDARFRDLLTEMLGHP
jgi:hypothetical protein